MQIGDAAGRVLCALANGHFADQVPTELPRHACIDSSALQPQAGDIGVTSWAEGTQITRRLHPTDVGHTYVFPYEVASDYSADFASMAYVRDYARVGTYVAIAFRVSFVEEKYTAVGEPYLQVMGVDTERVAVGPLRLWQRRAGDLHAGRAYVFRGLKVVNDRMWDALQYAWIRSSDAPKTVECCQRTAWEDVDDLESITQYL